VFQFNLEKYVLIYWERGLSNLNYIRNITNERKNKIPEIFNHQHWYVDEVIKATGFAPFYENTFHGETNYIPDRMFFNYKNRQQALNRISCGISWSHVDYSKIVFKDFDYVNANDSDLITFMNERYDRRLKFEAKINQKSFYFN
jgi:hypothetical protein